jgi:hypothetical protein
MGLFTDGVDVCPKGGRTGDSPVSAEAPHRQAAHRKISALRIERTGDRDVKLVFSLPAESWVSLRILDVTGRQIAVLQEGFLSAGCHSLTWTSHDMANRGLGSGMYFAQLEVNGDLAGHGRICLVR